MAKATCEKVKVEQITFKEEKQIDLQLNEDEARFVYNLMNKVGGCPTNSRRRHADAIGKALVEGAGFKYSRPTDMTGNIFCTE